MPHNAVRRRVARDAIGLMFPFGRGTPPVLPLKPPTPVQPGHIPLEAGNSGTCFRIEFDQVRGEAGI